VYWAPADGAAALVRAAGAAEAAARAGFPAHPSDVHFVDLFVDGPTVDSSVLLPTWPCLEVVGAAAMLEKPL
jgi:hypothetical protein